MVEVTCSTTLFTVGTFPMIFVLAKNNENKIVAQMIQHGGGCIASSRGPYGICLSSPKYVVLLRNEVVFSTDFIKDCCMANRILDINQYRLGRPSSCPDNFDAMKVLLRQSQWPTFAERDENDTAHTDRHSDSDSTMESQNSRTNIGSYQSLQETAESGDGGSSSKVVSQRHLEEHRSNRLPSTCESPIRNDGNSLEKVCGRRLPEKRKPFRIRRALESPDSDSDSDSDSHPGNTNDQRLHHIHQFNKSTRQQSVINSPDEVDSGNEEDRRAPVVQRTNEERRKSSDTSSTDNDWFLATDQEQHHGNTNTTRHKPKTTRKRRREEFTMEEEYAILTYLQKNNRFSNTGGNNVWKNMAAKEPVGKRHTWQSLRERYLKKIVPNINKYNLPEEIKRRVKYK